MVEIRLPHQDHYEIARQRWAERFRERFDRQRLTRLGAVVGEEGAVTVPSLCWRLRARLDPVSVTVEPDGREAGIVWQILVLEYLAADPGRPPVRFVSFADFPQARSYLKAFEGRVTGRLTDGVGKDRGRFARAAQGCCGVPGSERPLSYLFHFFPSFELQVVRYEGDEEFPPACNVLFADNALDILSAESMIVAAERLVSALHGKGPCS